MYWLFVGVAVGNLAAGYLLGAVWGFSTGGSTKQKSAATTPHSQMEDTPANKAASSLQAMEAFKAQLAAASAALKEHVEDPNEFDHSAEKLRRVNHSYLESAETALQEWAPDSGDAEQRKAYSESTLELQRRATEVESLLANANDQQGRKRVVDASEKMVKLVDTDVSHLAKLGAATNPNLQQPLADRTFGAENPAQDHSPLTGLETLDKLCEILSRELAAGEQPCVVGVVQIDPNSSVNDPLMGPRLEAAVGERVRRSLDANHRVAAKEGVGYLLALPGDNTDSALNRLETIRCQLEADTFLNDQELFKLTVSCAVVETEGCAGPADVLARMEETIGEAERFGRNRTYHHDGRFAAPAMTEEIEVQGRRIAV